MPNSRLGSQARRGARPRTDSTRAASAGGISQAYPTGSNAAGQHESADEGEEAALRHGSDRSRPTAATRGQPAAVREGRRRFGPTRDRLADDRAKLSTASGPLPHPAPAGRRRRVARRQASLAPRSARLAPRCRQHRLRAAQADAGTLPRPRAAVNTPLTCGFAHPRRSTRTSDDGDIRAVFRAAAACRRRHAAAWCACDGWVGVCWVVQRAAGRPRCRWPWWRPRGVQHLAAPGASAVGAPRPTTWTAKSITRLRVPSRTASR